LYYVLKELYISSFFQKA